MMQAEGEVKESEQPKRIKALDPSVVNKIAAGEIIVAPVNALKELIENSVDAGSTSLDILVKDGGLKLLQITDNGCGIQKGDLPILCERHTTSKISAFEDLSSISTYGFRGEALASISHIAHVTVTTKTRDSVLAWRAHYQDGVLVAPKPGQSSEPKGVAGLPGTQITVEDLFFNVPMRRRAFRSNADEFNKIIDMVGRYAVHCKGVGFTCKKAGDASNTLSIRAQTSAVDRIRQIYGNNVAHELIEFTASEERWGVEAHGLVTNANYNAKKTTLLLFINHRSVESSLVKKAVERSYANFLPKDGHPFVYLSLEIDPARVDVNVHPTKREVHFLNQDEIVEAVCQKIEAELVAVDTSRTFMTQTHLPGAKPPSPAEDGPDFVVKIGPVGGRRTRRNSNDLVRTDTLQPKITAMLPPSVPGAAQQDEGPLAVPEQLDYRPSEREYVRCGLASILQLRAEVREEVDEDLTAIFDQHTYVGMVDEQRRLVAIQAGVKLYLIDYGKACHDLFYQIGLTNFGNFGAIRFTPPLNLGELIRTAAEGIREEFDDPEYAVETLVEAGAGILTAQREMLERYLSMEISAQGELVSIPLLIRGYMPNMGKLPIFLLEIGRGVNWVDEGEKERFRMLLTKLAEFYVPEQLPVGDDDDDEEEEEEEDAEEAEEEEEEEEEEIPAEVRKRRQNVRWAVEHIFFPAFKNRLVSTRRLMKDGVREAANLKGLYREFERC